MATIRRLYAYAAALAALEVWLWSLVSLLTKALKGQAWQHPEGLAGALAGFLIGLPVFALHWRWMQREAATEAEERASTVRAVALYLALALTWGVVFHALAALVGRGLEAALSLPLHKHLFPNIRWTRAVAMLVVHAPAGWYFSRVLAANDQPSPAQAAARRWYRWLWLSYALLWFALGLQQSLTVFAPPREMLAPAALTRFAAQGIVFLAGALTLLVGWGRGWWRETQREEAERQSGVPVGFLALWALAGLGIVLVVLGIAIDRLLMRAFGDATQTYIATRLVLTLGVPWLVVWLSAQRSLMRLLQGWDASRRAAVYRALLSVVALEGLSAVSSGVLALLAHLTAAWFNTPLDHNALAAGITFLLLGLPLWALSWRALQAEARADASARHTLLRRGYLYLILFTALLTLMGFATALTFQLLRALLGGHFSGRQFTFSLGMAIWASMVLGYHARALRADRRAGGTRTAQRLAAFRVLVIAAPDAPWLTELQKHISAPAAVLSPNQEPPTEENTFNAVILHTADLTRLPAAWQTWLADFSGVRVLIHTSESPPWVWANGVQTAAKALHALALGKRPPQSHPSTLWRILGYVGIFALISWALRMLLPFLMMLTIQGMD